MRFLLIIWRGDAYDAPPTPEEFERDSAAHGAFADFLRGQGADFDVEVLKPPGSARQLMAVGDDLVVTDGPYIDIKEHIAGFYRFEAPDMGTASTWARRCPNYGRNELRPLWDMAELTSGPSEWKDRTS